MSDAESPITRSYDSVPRLTDATEPPAAQLLVALDCHQLQRPSARISLGTAREIVLGRAAQRADGPTRSGNHRRLCVGLPDKWMSGTHARLVRCQGRWTIEDAGSKNGTRVNGVPTAQHALVDGDIIEVGSTFLLFSACPNDVGPPAVIDAAALADQPIAMVTLNAALARQLDGLRRIARSEVPVLVTGESGTGKELTVRALHELSARRARLVAVNCGAIPPTLIHAELFGCRRGAYSDAVEDRQGLLRSADGGTLFLDEVAELPEPSQTALLRFLQEGEVRPVGDARAHHIDVRVVAATHRDLERRVRDGLFRQDLYARLAGYRVDLPALRDRREDLGILIRAILRDLDPVRADRLCLRPSAARALFNYDFPLNIRELRHALQTALALSDDGVILRQHLPPAMTGPRPPSARELSGKDRALRATVEHLLSVHAGNISAVGREMGKAPVQIRRWCRRFDIDLATLRERTR